MDTNDALRALRSAGADVVVRDARHIEVDGRVYRHYALRKTGTRADAVKALAVGGNVLLTSEKLAPSLRELALGDRRVIVVTDDATIVDRRVRGSGEGDDETVEPVKGRSAYARFAIARTLLRTRQGLTQQQIADMAGVTQGAVTKALRTSLFAGVVARGRGAIVATDLGELFARVLAKYPGPGGIATYWWKEGSPSAQASEVAEGDPTSLISGDVAADRLRSWRRPQHAVVYSDGGVDPRRRGYAMADADDYTLVLIHPADYTLAATAKTWRHAHPGIADPIIAAYDVRRTADTGDQEEAVSRLREYALELARD